MPDLAEHSSGVRLAESCTVIEATPLCLFSSCTVAEATPLCLPSCTVAEATSLCLHCSRGYLPEPAL